MQSLISLLSRNKFIGFLFVGGFNTLACFIVYALLLKLGIYYLLASIIMFIFGVLEGYTLNSYLVFKVKPQFKSLLKFTTVYCIILGLNLIMMYVFVDLFHIDALPAQIITSAVLAGVNFYLIRLFVYRHATQGHN